MTTSVTVALLKDSVASDFLNTEVKIKEVGNLLVPSVKSYSAPLDGLLYQIQGIEDSGMQGCRDSGMQGYRDSGIQGRS